MSSDNGSYRPRQGIEQNVRPTWRPQQQQYGDMFSHSQPHVQAGQTLQNQGYTHWADAGADTPMGQQFGWDASQQRWVPGSAYSNQLGGGGQQQSQVPQYGGGGGGGGRWGGGGGGGGYGGGAPPGLDAFAAAMQQIIGQMPGVGDRPTNPLAGLAGNNPYSGLENPYAGIQNPYAGLTNPYEGIENPLTGMESPLGAMIDPAVDAAIRNAQQVYGGIGDRISTDNPYANFAQQTPAPQLRNDLGDMVARQGGGLGTYNRQVANANAAISDADRNWQNYAAAAGTNHVASQQALLDLARMQGENIVQGFEGQRTGLQAANAMQNFQLQQQAAMLDHELAMQSAGWSGQNQLANNMWGAQNQLASQMWGTQNQLAGGMWGSDLARDAAMMGYQIDNDYNQSQREFDLQRSQAMMDLVAAIFQNGGTDFSFLEGLL